MKGHEFAKGLKEGRYTSLGSYPRFLVTCDGGALCWDCASEEAARIRLAAMTGDKCGGWLPEGWDVNWESRLSCDNCSADIEAAYPSDDATGKRG